MAERVTPALDATARAESPLSLGALAPARRAGTVVDAEGARQGRAERGAGVAGPGRPFLMLLALAAGVALFAFLPPATENARQSASVLGAAGFLAAWAGLLAVLARARAPRVQTEVVKAHWVQGAVQFCVYVYWSLYWTEIRLEAPLIASQVFYLLALQGLLAWTRGHAWRLGFGVLPVIFSTNLLLWFKPDWYYLQYAMVTAGALGKELVTWVRDGRRTHIFNPSVFGQSLAAIVLIAMGATFTYTWGAELAAAFETLEHAYLLLFFLGLIVQWNFRVTLVTFAATAALTLCNLAYTGATGLYYFVSVNIGATIFLGLHLLVTDPATSPRTNVGRIVYGFGYGALYFGLYRVFESFDVPPFWDKLLPVPILNLLVPWFERVSRLGALGRLNAWWEAFDVRKANRVHIAAWSALFLTLYGTGFIGGEHPGASPDFWEAKARAGNERARQVLEEQVRYGAALGNADSQNRLGLLALDGKLVERDPALAAHMFARAAEQGHLIACENLVGQYLFEGTARSLPDVERALDRLEAHAETTGEPNAAFLVGVAYERGKGRPKDLQRALAFVQRAAARGHAGAESLVVPLRAELDRERSRGMGR